MMGSSPLNIVPLNNPTNSKKVSWADAKKNDPDLDKHVAERNKHKPGSVEYEKYQALINAAHGVERDQNLKTAQIKNANAEEETNVDKKNDQSGVTLDDVESKDDITEKRGGNLGEVFKGLGKVGIAGLTAGLDEVYGTGKIQFAGGGTKFVPGTKDKDEDNTSVEDKVDELINKQV